MEVFKKTTKPSNNKKGMTDLEEERVAGLGRIMSLFSNENILTKEELDQFCQ